MPPNRLFWAWNFSNASIVLLLDVVLVLLRAETEVAEGLDSSLVELGMLVPPEGRALPEEMEKLPNPVEVAAAGICNAEDEEDERPGGLASLWPMVVKSIRLRVGSANEGSSAR